MLTHSVDIRCVDEYSRREVLPAMTKQPTVPDVGADGIDPSAAVSGQTDGQVSRSMILQAALRIIDRDGIDGLSMRRLSDEVGGIPRCSIGTYRARRPCSMVSPRKCSSSYA